jgi:hypothetical protein
MVAESDLLDQHRRAVRAELDQARRTATALIAAPPMTLAQGIVPLERSDTGGARLDGM